MQGETVKKILYICSPFSWCFGN